MLINQKASEKSDVFLCDIKGNRHFGKTLVRSWFDKQVKSEDRSILHKAVLDGDTDTIENYVSNLLVKSISTFDSEESFYHRQYVMTSDL